jgi:hypothetical protein
MFVMMLSFFIYLKAGICAMPLTKNMVTRLLLSKIHPLLASADKVFSPPALVYNEHTEVVQAVPLSAVALAAVRSSIERQFLRYCTQQDANNNNSNNNMSTKEMLPSAGSVNTNAGSVADSLVSGKGASSGPGINVSSLREGLAASLKAASWDADDGFNAMIHSATDATSLLASIVSEIAVLLKKALKTVQTELGDAIPYGPKGCKEWIFTVADSSSVKTATEAAMLENGHTDSSDFFDSV